MEEEKGAETGETLTFQVKFKGRSIPVSLSSDSTVKDLKSFLQPLTNVLIRGQKLFFKGKVLMDTMTLQASEVINGSKLMLTASQGLHQGDGPIIKEVAEPRRPSVVGDQRDCKKAVVTVDKSRAARWKLTGVVALSECGLKAIPDEVWTCGSSMRVLDLSKNYIHDLPAKIRSSSCLQKLLLDANDITDDSISWESVSSLKFLTVLSLSQNHLTTLPSSVGFMVSLRQLHVANNRLTSLPDELGLLNQLQILKANNNRISNVPSCIGNCSSLFELDLSSNLLVDLPETFGNLQHLKALHLRNNGLKSLPCALFKLCCELSTLDLHGTEITNDLLRQLEGWEDFDERRRSKHQKQLDFSVVGCSAGFDEGADKD